MPSHTHNSPASAGHAPSTSADGPDDFEALRPDDYPAGLPADESLAGLEDSDDPENPENPENIYDSYDEHLSDDFHAEERVRARSLLSEQEQKAEKRLLRRGRLTDRERERLAERREDQFYAPSLPEGADRWSTWGEGELGPEPRPGWLVVADGAVDSRLGVVKTGKEADVHLVERWLPGPRPVAGPGTPSVDSSCLLAEKIYRNNEHRNFHRDAAYVDGRRTRESRMDRAVANRTRFGLKIIAEQWAIAEFAALGTLWAAGAPVPYPVQRVGTELLIEFIGDADGSAAPRLAALRPTPDELAELWGQLCSALEIVAGRGTRTETSRRGTSWCTRAGWC